MLEEEIADLSQPEELYERKVFVIDKGQEITRVDKWLQARIVNATRNKIQQNIDQGYLTVNGKIVKNNYKIKPGDELVLLSFINPDYTEVYPENIPLNIVFEDDHVLVVNKPPNMVVHPGIGNFRGTLLNGVAYYLQQQNKDTNDESLQRYGLVHRIDKNTTGLLVLAKTNIAAVHLAKQFFDHTVARNYIALVWGDVQEDQGTITGNISRHLQYRKMFTVFPEGDYGKHAVTHFKVLERFYYTTLVQCTLETGRTHQIRVHMKYKGHTLFNDREYGGEKILKGTVYSKYKQFVDNCFEICPRVALHARTLGFVHPVSKENMFFECPLPNDIVNVVDKWRGYKDIAKRRAEGGQ